MDRKTLEQNYQSSIAKPAELEQNYQKSSMGSLVQSVKNATQYNPSAPSTQPKQAAPAGASSGARKQSDTMKEQVDALKKQRDDATLKLSAYMRAGNMQKQAEEQLEIANRAGLDYRNAYTNWKNQRNMEAVEDYNPGDKNNKIIERGFANSVASGVQNFFQGLGQTAVVGTSYLSGNGAQATKAWKAKVLMDSGVKGTDAVKQVGLTDKREIPIVDYNTQAELRHAKDVERAQFLEGLGLNGVSTIMNMAPAYAAKALAANAPAVLALMAASAAGNKYVEAYEKYGNTDMAFILGLASGATSVFTEQIGGAFGKLGNTAVGKATSKKLMEEAPGLFLLANSTGGKWLRDAFSEGLEEGAEDAINYAIEKTLTGDSDEMDNFGYDMLLGALAGGVLGGVGTVVRTKAYNRLGKALNASPDAVSQLVEKGIEKGPGTAPYIYAQEVQKNPSNQMVGKLYDATVAYNADQGLSKLSTDVAQVTVEELKDMISLADRLAEAAKKLGVEANPEAVTAAVINKQTNAAVQAAENAVGEVYAPTVETPTNAGETAYNSALAGGVANQGIATRINNDPAAKQSFAALTGANFTGEAAHDIAEIQVATKRLAQSGKQAVSQSDYDAMVANAGEQARARVTAEQQAQVEQLNAESEARRQSLLYNTIVDENGKRHVKEITDTDVRGDTEIGYKKAEITKSKKKTVDAVNNAAKYLGKTIVWFDGALQINGQYRLANGFRAPDGTIYININSADPLMVTFGHEMFHDLVSGGKYGGMIDTLVESPEYAATIKVELEHKEELYRANGIELTADEAAEEVAADICGSILGSKSMLEYIGARNAETATGIKGWLDRILNKLKGKPTAQEAYERLSESQRALIDGMEGRTETEGTQGKLSLMGRGNGYDGRSMSNNARKAYENGEKSLSKWSKSEILEAIATINPNVDCSSLNADTLKQYFLNQSGWHHTSAMYNETRFYSVDEAYVADLTQNDVDYLADHQVKTAKSAARDTSNDSAIDDTYAKARAIVNAGIVKTEMGAINKLLAGKSFDESYDKAAGIIKARDASRVNAWRKLPEGHWRKEYADLYDDDINAYIKKMYAPEKLSRNSKAFKALEGYFKQSADQTAAKNVHDIVEKVGDGDATTTGKYSLIATDKGTAVSLDDDILGRIDTSSWDDTKKAIAKGEASSALKSFANGVVVNGITYKVNKVSRKEYTRSNYTEKLYKTNKNVFADKMRAAKSADEIIAATTGWSKDGKLKHQRTDNFVDFAHGNVLIRAGNNKYKAEVVVGITNAGEYVFYDVVDIAPTVFAEKKTTPTTVAGKNATNDIQGAVSNNIPQPEPAVNTHSMQTGAKNAQEKLSLMEMPTTDSTGRELSAEQQEYFKDSKVRDEDGNLLVVYHGTDADFTVFDASKGRANMDIQGMFFSPWELDAQGYGNNVSAYYLDIKNPASEAVGYKALNRFKGQNNAGVKAREYLQSLGYDGVNNGNEEYIAFEPSQIKRIDNLTPTGSKDIRYSLMDIKGENGKDYGTGVYLDSDLLTGLTDAERIQMVKEYVNEIGGRTFIAYDPNGNAVSVNIAKANQKFKNNKGKRVPVNKDLIKKNNKVGAKQDAVVLTDELISTSSLQGEKPANYPHGWVDNYGKNNWEYWKTFLQDKNNAIWEATLNVATTQNGEKILYDISPIKMVGRAVESAAIPTTDILSQTESAVNTHSMQNSQIDAQGDYSLMDTLPQEKYFADLDQAVAEAAAKSEEALKAAQTEVTNLRQQLLDYRNHADAEAKMNERWRDAEAKLVADLAAAREREKAAQLKAEYMQKYNSLAKQNREQYNEKVSALRDEYRQKQQQERTDRVVREEKAKSKARLDRAEAKSTTTEDVAEVLTEMPKKTEAEFKEKAAESWRTFKRNWVNTKDELERFGQAVGDHRITYAANNVGQASAAAQYSIGGLGQYDLNGHKIGEKNLKQIFEPAQKAGLTKEFYTYLLHEHNVDRMSIRERSQEQLAKLRADLDKAVPGFASLTDENLRAAASGDAVAAKPYTPEQIAAAKQYQLFREWVEKQFDKPVFGSSVTAADSRAAADKLLKEHPEFAGWGNDVYHYLDGLQEVRKQGGLISEEMVQRMKELYPHYVPTYRDMPSTSGGYSNPNSVAVNSTIKSAKGGNQAVMPIVDSMARQTLQVFSAAKKNLLGQMLYEDAMDTDLDVSEYIQNITEDGDLVDLDADTSEKLDNTLRIWVDGKPISLHMSKAMADGFRPIEQSNSLGMKLLRSANSTFKKLVTQWNPVFIVRNLVRDAQSALFFTHYSPATFVRNYGKAAKEIASNGKYWQLYQAMGGKGTTYYDPKTGLSDRRHFKNETADKAYGAFRKVIDVLSFANEAVEQYPRLAEFISTMEATGNVQEALYNAADITTNFGRGGFAARKLNASLVPFFNPGMQGLSKNVRNIIDRRGAKEIGQLISRLLLNGVMPGIIISLIYDSLDDDDYKELSNYIKDSNFLIKVGDNKFIKIPMGREPSVITAFTNRVWRWANGEPASSAFSGYPSFAIEQLAPNNPLNNNIFSGIYSMSTNKTWYGGDIVSSYMEDKPDYLQYDESTASFLIWLGEVTRHGKNGIRGISPKKIQYLIDQYSGFVGDWLLPAFSQKADAPAVVKAFVVDSVRQNRLGSDFYDALDEAKQAKETEQATASDEAVYSYLQKQSQAASAITKQLREVYNSDISKAEKMEKADDLLALRNEIYRKALLNVGGYEETAKSIGDADSDVVKREANRKEFGAQYALEAYNKAVYEKAQEYVAQGVTYDQYYAAYFATRGITGDKDENGKTVTNSASRKKKEAIDKAVSGATTKQKHLLYEALGVSEKVW